MKGFGANAQMGALLDKVELLTQGIFGIRDNLTMEILPTQYIKSIKIIPQKQQLKQLHYVRIR